MKGICIFIRGLPWYTISRRVFLPSPYFTFYPAYWYNSLPKHIPFFKCQQKSDIRIIGFSGQLQRFANYVHKFTGWRCFSIWFAALSPPRASTSDASGKSWCGGDCQRQELFYFRQKLYFPIIKRALQIGFIIHIKVLTPIENYADTIYGKLYARVGLLYLRNWKFDGE